MYTTTRESARKSNTASCALHAAHKALAEARTEVDRANLVAAHAQLAYDAALLVASEAYRIARFGV